MSITTINEAATIALKTAATAFLAASLVVGTSFYASVTDDEVAVPACSINVFSSWLKDGEIVSIFKAPIQPDVGMTVCMGTAMSTDGEFKGGYYAWTGSVENSTHGYLGRAVFVK